MRPHREPPRRRAAAANQSLQEYLLQHLESVASRPTLDEALERLGRLLDSERREVMLRRQLGLTKLYNLVNDAELSDASDSDAARMRVLHAELDRAVLAAYGWSDVDPDHGFHTFRKTQRWTVGAAARVELVDRLIEENHRRVAIEGGP